MVDAPPAVPLRALEQLRRGFEGDVITPTDPAYDDRRRLWNALLDRRPALILRPRTAAEVAIALRFAREHELEIAVRAGGHSHEGVRGADGGLVVDLTAMRGVEVDAAARRAVANGGALLGELDIAAQKHGLVCPVGVVGHTGVAGLTLGGGVGRLQRQFGLTVDQLFAVEIVTADGRIVRASADEEPELFWGLRGAGWNFGVATRFEFRLQPFGPDLHRGVLVFPASEVESAWAAFRAYGPQAPDAVSAILGIDHAAPDAAYADEVAGRPIVMIAFNHSGRAEDVERDVAPLLAIPRRLDATLGSQAYLEVQTAHDLELGWGHRSFIAGLNADDVHEGAFAELVDLVARAPGQGSFSVTAMGGAIGRVAEDAMAFAGRDARFDLSADIAWSDPAQDEANRAWVRETMAVVEPDATLGRYANENADAGPAHTRLLYGDAKLARLAALKRACDPDNVFRVNHNIAPSPDG
ncbi:MAG: FAD-binding oxidoreductase [Chloroflexota bacterium]